MTKRHSITIFLLLLFIKGIGQEVFFKEEHVERGIDHIFRHAGFIGGGAAFFDFDNDGDDDLYLTSGQDMDQLYENDGTGYFTLISLEAGLIITQGYYTTGVTCGDINQDGFDDIFVTTRNSDYDTFAKNLLFLNQGDRTFIDIWWGISENDYNYSINPNFIDFDLDGDLDIYVTNYIENANVEQDENNNTIAYDHICFENLFFENLGNGMFSEIGSTQAINSRGCSLASLTTDYDMDGDSDLLVANDFGEFVESNNFYNNNYPNLGFTDLGETLGADQRIYGMGIAHGDFDLDGDFDYYITNYGRNILLQNEGTHFTEMARELNIDDTYITGDSLLAIGWGAVFLDIDNDMDLDLYVGNGYVPGPDFIPSFIKQPDRLFLNEGGTFRNITEEAGIENTSTTRGVAYSDIDLDGDLDIFVLNEKVPLNDNTVRSKLYINQSTTTNNYIQVSLEGSDVNKNGIGSIVKVQSESKTLVKELVNASSHCSHNSRVLHFGLGQEKVEKLEIFWPGQQDTTVVLQPNINSRIRIIQEMMNLDSIEVDSTIIDSMMIDTTIIDTISRINELNDEPIFSIFPNPSTDQIQITIFRGNIDAVGIEILSANGISVFQQVDYSIGEKVHIDELSPGLYIMKIRIKETVQSLRFLKY